MRKDLPAGHLGHFPLSGLGWMVGLKLSLVRAWLLGREVWAGLIEESRRSPALWLSGLDLALEGNIEAFGSWTVFMGLAFIPGWRNPAIINCPFTFSGVIAPTAEGVNIKNHHGRACSCPGVFIILFHFFIFAQFLNPICSFLFRTFLYSPRSRLFLLSCHCYLDMSFLSFLMNIFEGFWQH